METIVRGLAVRPRRSAKCMPHRKAVILVVEDIPIIRMCALDLAIDAGFEALEASSADDAIRVLKARPDIRLVFTDVEMPGMIDGIKLSHYIRNRRPPVKLIVASGKAIGDEHHLPSGASVFDQTLQRQQRFGHDDFDVPRSESKHRGLRRRRSAQAQARSCPRAIKNRPLLAYDRFSPPES
jgi:CheY-like chemotaxis protein